MGGGFVGETVSVKNATYDVIAVGGGAAGLSAALVLGRARRTVLVCDDGRPRNAAAERMHGFLTHDGRRPADFGHAAREELARYPSVTTVDESVVAARRAGDAFAVTLASGSIAYGRRILLTTGVVDQLPPVEGLAERWGRSVFVCPFCDGWEVRDERIAVCGSGREAVSLAEELYGWSHDLVVCPDRDDLTARDRAWIAASGVTLHVGRLRRLVGARGSLERAEFADGDQVACSAAFVSAPLRQHSPLVRSLGCALTATCEIAIDSTNQTSVRGCYAAGDAATTVHQVVVAAASGARAAIGITGDLLQEDADALAQSRAAAVSFAS